MYNEIAVGKQGSKMHIEIIQIRGRKKQISSQLQE